MIEHYEENRYRDEDLIPLKVYGVTLGDSSQRPTFILKDETGKHILPVPVTPMEAGVAMQQANQGVLPTTPHRVTEKLLETLNIRIEKAVFVEIRNHLQYVRLYFDGHPSYGSLKVRADEAMSLCLHLNVPLFVAPQILKKSKIMQEENQGILQDLRLNQGAHIKHHQYIQ